MPLSVYNVGYEHGYQDALAGLEFVDTDGLSENYDAGYQDGYEDGLCDPHVWADVDEP